MTSTQWDHVPSALAICEVANLCLPLGLQVLEDVTEYETSADGVTETQMEQILLNGNNIALLVPGGKPE